MALPFPKKQFKHVLRSESKRAKAETLSVFEPQPPQTESYDITETNQKLHA